MIVYLYYRNKAKLSSGPPDHTPRQRDDATPPAPSVTTAKAGSESSEGEGVATTNSGRRRKGKAKNKRKPTKVSYYNIIL